jgi:hypothetical protein
LLQKARKCFCNDRECKKNILKKACKGKNGKKGKVPKALKNAFNREFNQVCRAPPRPGKGKGKGKGKGRT